MLETNNAAPQTDTTVYLKDYQPSAFLIPTVELEVELNGDIATVTSRLKVVRQTKSEQAITLDGEKLELKSIKLNGQPLDTEHYEQTDDQLIVKTQEDEFELEVVTELEPKLNTELSGLYQSSGNYCTQCEAEGFRRITYFLDRPDVLSVYSVTIFADKTSCPVLLSNGNLVDTGRDYDGRHWAKWHDPHPKPSYLFALVAGDLEHVHDVYTTTSGDEVQLNIYTQSHNIELCEHAMQSLKNAMHWDEQTYAREYLSLIHI